MKYLKYILFTFIAVLAVSCEDYFGEDSNVDPDNPIEATPNVILPQIQGRLVYTYGGDIARYTAINTQHMDGVARQFAVIGAYGIVATDCDTPWSNLYSGTMGSNRALLDLARENGFNHYAGISLALEALTMMVITDAWGDAPYSDAFKFGENGVYNPTFDSQQAIYDAIFNVLDEARSLLSGDDGGNPVGSDDLFYGGDASQWIKFCNVLEARGKLHLINSGATYADVMTALNKGGFDSPVDDAGVQFAASPTANAPMFQYIQQRDDCETGASYVALLSDLNDPRVNTLGAPHDGNHPIFTNDQKVNVLSYIEQEFIKAEALLGTDADAAYEAYLNGIEASFMTSGTDGAEDYIAQAEVGVGAGNLTMNEVITQKYIALLMDPEVFSDWRRTGIPSLSPVTGSSIPRRLPYPQTEFLANSNTPSPGEVTIFSRVWWDSE